MLLLGARMHLAGAERQEVLVVEVLRQVPIVPRKWPKSSFL